MTEGVPKGVTPADNGTGATEESYIVNIQTDFGYAFEKFSKARSALMAPNFGDETRSFSSALFECQLALGHLNPDDIDDEHARTLVRRIEEVLDTSGIDDPEGLGTLAIKLDRMHDEERLRVSSAIDELASWTGSEFWKGTA